MNQKNTFGPAYDYAIDGTRIRKQHDVIRDTMLSDLLWWTLDELEKATGYPQASISAQLRHLRKPEFGSFIVEKRRRVTDRGTWEYQVKPRIINGQCLMEGIA